MHLYTSYARHGFGRVLRSLLSCLAASTRSSTAMASHTVAHHSAKVRITVATMSHSAFRKTNSSCGARIFCGCAQHPGGAIIPAVSLIAGRSSAVAGLWRRPASVVYSAGE